MKRVLIFSLLLIIGNAIGQNHYFNEIDHIPLMILKSTGTQTEPSEADFKKIIEIGADIFHCDGLNVNWYNYIIENSDSYLKIIPYTVPTLGQNNFIAKYSEAMYSEWSVVDNREQGTYSFMNDTTKVNKVSDYIITKANATEGEIVIGPDEYYGTHFFRGYPQQEKFLIDNAGSYPIRYNLRIELKIGEDLYQTPPSGIENTDADICELQVGYWMISNEMPERFIVKESRLIKLSDFENSFGVWKEFGLDNDYTWANTNTESLPMYLQKENIETRKFQMNMEFRLIWKAYPYRQLSVRKLYLFDTERGKPFIEETPNLPGGICEKITKMTENQLSDNSLIFDAGEYDTRVIGWNAVDEPGSGENYACMRKIDELMNAASGGKRRLFFSNPGIFNGWGGKNVLPYPYPNASLVATFRFVPFKSANKIQ